MASSLTKYTHTPRRFSDGTFDVDTDTFKIALVTSNYVFSASHTVWANASTYEVSSGNGYTTGGETVTLSITNTEIDALDVAWASLTKTFRGAILYKSGTANGLTNPLVAYILFDTTPSDVTISGNQFRIIWNPSGLFTLS